MDTKPAASTQKALDIDVESRRDVFVRQVDDRALPALQVLAEQQLGLAGEIPRPLFIP
jgi:hypothetical protein